MALPAPPPYSDPIPNNPFYWPLQFYIQGPYSPLILGSGLNVDYETSVISSTGGGGGGVTSVLAGPGINVSSPTGNVTITNTGVRDLTAGAGISISASTGSVAITATTLGTVTQVTTGAGLTGGPITTTGTVSLSTSGVTAGTYASPSSLTVDVYGRITAVASGSNVTAVTATAPLVSSGGITPNISIVPATTLVPGSVQLTDSVTNTSSSLAATALAVKTANDNALAAIPKSCILGPGTLVTGIGASLPAALAVGTDGHVLYACSAAPLGLCWAPPSTSPSGVTSITAGTGLTGGTITTTGTIALDNTAVTPGSYGYAWITVDAQGRITSAASCVAPNTTVTSPITNTGTAAAPVIGILDANDTQKGAVELATTVETQAGTSTALAITPAGAKATYVPLACYPAKGDLLVGSTSANTPIALTLSVTNGEVLTVDSACPGGVKWAAVSAGGVANATPTVRGIVFGCTGGTNDNTFLGQNAGVSTTVGYGNTLIGIDAGRSLTDGGENVYIGCAAGCCAVSSYQAVIIGYEAGCANAAPEGTTLVGAFAGRDTEGTYNTLIGAAAGESLFQASDNTALGCGAMLGAGDNTGTCNVAVGHTALDAIEGAASRNTVLGATAGSGISTGSNNVAIGYCAQVADGTSDCQLAIGFSVGNYWLTGNSTKAIKPGAGIIDSANSCGSPGMVLTSQGNAVSWSKVSSANANPNYGVFNSTSTQTIGAINTGQAVNLNPVAGNNFTLVGTSQIRPTIDGTYNLQISLQIISTAGGGGDVEIWFVKNGVAIADSNTRYSIKNTNEEEVVALNFVDTFVGGDLIEIYWASDNTSMTLSTLASTMGGPAIPSAIVTIVPVGA